MYAWQWQQPTLGTQTLSFVSTAAAACLVNWKKMNVEKESVKGE